MGQAAVHIDEYLLTERLMAGDPGARELVYDYYGPALYSIILQVISDEKRAQDVLTAVFLRIYNDIYAYRDSGSTTLFGWMMRLAREMALSESMEGGGEVGAGIMPHGYHSLQRFSKTLSPEMQKVFHLCYYKGLPKEAVARMMGIQS